MTDETTLAEATMIYRKPVTDSDPLAIQDIWGQQLETRTVDASEVNVLKGEGWVTHPSHIEHPPSADDVPLDRKSVDAELKALRDHISALESDLKAATDLADAESKAKDQALAKITELAAGEKPTLGVKAAKPTA
jgi:hypothetical protein